MGVIVSCGVFWHFRNFKCCLPWYRPLLHCMTPFPGYIIMQHTAAFTPPHLLQPTRQSGWLWTWLDAVKKTSNQAVEAAAWAPRQYWFSAGVSEHVTSVARRRGGHRGVIKEGLVILVSRSPAGRLWGRALISTNRFLIRASQALQPHQFPNPPLVLTRDNPTVVGKNISSFRKMESACKFKSEPTTPIPSCLKGESSRKWMGWKWSWDNARFSRQKRSRRWWVFRQCWSLIV